ncbi:tRNA (guanine(26)-N(2))-dimethyltransferase [Natronorubrum daqingense]|uniref:tRNA (guanine(26)-N(2))-dimethyltransferase n=1 Tax=Natronorubrum daqingense TaxID=588898 RepID=A0A1N7A0F2_9EURY|nr:tRNA (guanine(26)-N(2))-dimethyltransferase [Natronorubrum daqingense]APX95186.1 tRNA (guanine(10)-N(2))-dimethyltransferase [Natronorubrum daqingense]SIR32541.1 tRNA (guanine26-N2/guanine27-N2)-dimethyltransferase [Natronorubrum daqingense]
MRVTEGGVELEVPGEQTEGVEESVFYNPRQELNRDLTIATLRAFREHEDRAESYLDAMAASGIRGVRAAADGWDVTCCDVEPDAVDLARANLERNGLEDARVEHRNVTALMHESMFDVIDLDPYGTPMPFADAAFSRCRDLVCVTATDTAPLCGAHFNSGVRSYSAVPQNTDYHPEMGVRILLSALARSAARFDVGVEPILTHATSHYVRTYLELDRKPTAADAALEHLGYVSSCEDCLYREAEHGLIADPLETCPNCGGKRLLVAGPIWLGPYRDREFVADVRERIPDSFATAEKGRELCTTLETELDEPTHYDQHKLCKNWGLPANAMDDFLADLRESGYEASPAHYGGTTFKTDASVGEMFDATSDSLE